MSLKELNALVTMQQNELIRFKNAIKEKEEIMLKYLKKHENGIQFNFKMLNKKGRLFDIRGSFEKHLVTNRTKDCDAYIYINITQNDVNNFIKDSKNIKMFKSKFETFLKNIFKTQIKAISSTKPTVDLILYDDKVLSLIPALIFPDGSIKTCYVNDKKPELRTTRAWNKKSKFNENIEKFGSAKRKNVRRVIKIVKFSLKPCLQNLSASPLETYILEQYFLKHDINNYFESIKQIFKLLSSDELTKFINNHKVFSKWGWTNKNNNAVNQIINKSTKISNELNSFTNLIQFEKFLQKERVNNGI